MRFLLRLTGTWLLGMTLILLVMDGTKSFAANALVMTSLQDVWQMAHAGSLASMQRTLGEGSAELFRDMVVLKVLSWPGWAVIGLPGLLLVFAGRPKRRRTGLL